MTVFLCLRPAAGALPLGATRLTPEYFWKKEAAGWHKKFRMEFLGWGKIFRMKNLDA
jgi:hypothetical protein